MALFARSVFRPLSRGILLLGLLAGSSCALAQQKDADDAPVTIRLQPEDLQRGKNGSQSNFFFLPPGATTEAL